MNLYIKKEMQLFLTALIGALFWMIIVLGFDSNLFRVVRVVCASIFFLFLPGYWLVQALFTRGEIDVIEHIALSFALSISVIPLLVFYINLVGVKISVGLVTLATAVIILLAYVYILFRRRSGS